MGCQRVVRGLSDCFDKLFEVCHVVVRGCQ